MIEQHPKRFFHPNGFELFNGIKRDTFGNYFDERQDDGTIKRTPVRVSPPDLTPPGAQ